MFLEITLGSEAKAESFLPLDRKALEIGYNVLMLRVSYNIPNSSISL